jgi:hypothetical protein
MKSSVSYKYIDRSSNISHPVGAVANLFPDLFQEFLGQGLLYKITPLRKLCCDPRSDIGVDSLLVKW